MKLIAALALFTAVSSAVGYKCYLCTSLNPKPCTNKVTCADLLTLNGTSFRCFTSNTLGVVTRGCISPQGCGIGPVRCCKGELCNASSGPVTLPPAVLLLLGLSTFITLYLNQD